MKNRMYNIIGIILLFVLFAGCAAQGGDNLVFSDEQPMDKLANESADLQLVYPTDGVITQFFTEDHHAIDFARRDESEENQAIFAAADGVVTEVSTGTWHEGDGNYILIDHGNGVQTAYSHLDEVAVNVGDTVTQGQEIATMGNTGRVIGATGVTLHFELWMDGALVNPMDYLE